MTLCSNIKKFKLNIRTNTEKRSQDNTKSVQIPIQIISLIFVLAKPDATEEEIDEALESGNTQIFANQILDQKRHEQAKDALIYIESRHRDIMRLEQSIRELHQLFMDMAVLVEAQGELIDQIEYNVNQSVAYTKDAVKNLRKANELQKKSRKKMCCLIVILLIVVVLLVSGLGGLFGGGVL